MEQSPVSETSRPVDRRYLVGGIVLIVVGIGVTLLGLREVQLLRWRDAGHAHVAAKIDGLRIFTSTKSDAGPEVKYHFTLDGTTYSFADATGGKHLWAKITHDEYAHLTGKDTVVVSYNADHPWANAPVHASGMPTLDTYAALVFGLGILVSGAMVFGNRRRPVGTPTSADAGPAPQ